MDTKIKKIKFFIFFIIKFVCDNLSGYTGENISIYIKPENF